MESTTKKKSVFETLSAISVAGKVEKIGKLSYLSWAYAWGELKKAYPNAYYTIYENAQGLNYHTDGRTCWVKTGVTVDGLEHIEYLPVMDYNHKSIPLELVTSYNVNTSIQRSLTKAVARHGLGLAVYAGEDLLAQKEGEAKAASEKPKDKDFLDNYQPLGDGDYTATIVAAAEGRKTKDGENIKDWWIRKTHASGFVINQFDDDVDAYKRSLGQVEA